MNRRIKVLLSLTIVTLAVVAGQLFMNAPAVTAAPATTPMYLSPVAMAPNKAGTTIYIVQATANRIDVFDVASEKVTKSIDLGLPLTGLALSQDETKLYVTAAETDGNLRTVDIKTGKITATTRVGHTPMSPVVSPDGKKVYIGNRFGRQGTGVSIGSISVVDLALGKEVKTEHVPREPTAIDISNDGKSLIIANHLPATASDQDYAAAEVTIIDVDGKNDPIKINLPNGAMALRGVEVSPDGKMAAVTHMLARFHLPTTQLERGWMNTNAISLIDVAGKKLINTILLDDVDHGAANPWAIAWTADSQTLCVTHAGTHEISVIDMKALMAKLDKAVAEKKDKEVQNDLSFLVGIRRRLKLAGNGPRSMTIIGNKAYVCEYFTDSMSVLDISPDSRPVAKAIALGPKIAMTPARKGEMFFNDAQLCFQMWQSCATCHPDGRTDGLNWDLMNDGMGNPKSTKSLLLAHRTPPAMITGIRASAEVGVRAGIRFIQFAVRPEEDAQAIDAYLKAMTPIPSPFLVNGELTASAKRGKILFDGVAGCAACHNGKLLTDLEKYDVGTGKESEAKKEFDTPTLVEIWRTAPYLYDGRAVTIVELLKPKYNAKDLHGTTTKLTPKQKADLAEYILSQ
ncbi:MAG: c-type cytochrome [Phycisphaerales bacterium]|jgi:DNA-binding beta-propeller fold protein YncE|nr:c-type cytochrome [Phycisphaerales bacterium]